MSVTLEEKAKKRGYGALDITRLLMAAVVVAIHTRPLLGQTGAAAALFDALAFLPVPFFLMCTGYFSFMKAKTADELKKTTLTLLKKFILLFLGWTAAYLPITIWHFVTDGMSLAQAAASLFFGTFLTGEQFYSWHLWYLLCCVYSLILLFILFSVKAKRSLIASICVILYALGHVITYLVETEAFKTVPIVGFLSKTIGTGRLLTGAAFIYAGILLGELTLRRIHVICCAVSFFALEAVLMFVPEPFCSIFRIVPAVCLFVSLAGIDLGLPGALGVFLRKSSSYVYYLHMYVFFLYTLIFKEFRYFGPDAFWITLAVASAISFAVSLIALRLKRRKAGN